MENDNTFVYRTYITANNKLLGGMIRKFKLRKKIKCILPQLMKSMCF